MIRRTIRGFFSYSVFLRLLTRPFRLQSGSPHPTLGARGCDLYDGAASINTISTHSSVPASPYMELTLSALRLSPRTTTLPTNRPILHLRRRAQVSAMYRPPSDPNDVHQGHDRMR